MIQFSAQTDDPVWALWITAWDLTDLWSQMNHLSLRNNLLKFETLKKLLMVFRGISTIDLK
jgi:hypothetical protein